MRVRFAPSPTGGLHIGGLRTALFNYLVVKQHGGQFVLRIEDTDEERFVEGAEAYIVSALDWLGLKPDEGPGIGGKYAPYRQSERKELYQKYAQKLVNQGDAYYAFDTSEELSKMREDLKAAGVVLTQYNATSRMRMNNSLTWSKEKVDKWMAEGNPYVIRFKVSPKGSVIFQDKVRGRVFVENSQIDDKILLKSSGMPTYHLANVIDDHEMDISHVIRGEEWLPSTPLHCLLYEALGWTSSRPTFVPTPLILKPKGPGKLSKRDADKAGFPIFPLTWMQPGMSEPSVGFCERGYLPEAMVNFLVLMGWSPGDHQELFSMEELINRFSLDNIIKAGAKFDIDKAKWFNKQYLKKRPLGFLSSFLKKAYPDSEHDYDTISQLFVERIDFPQDIVEKSAYLFDLPKSYDEKAAKKKWTVSVVAFLERFSAVIRADSPQTPEAFQSALSLVAQEQSCGVGQMMAGVRLAVTGQAGGPDLLEMMVVLGVERICERITIAKEKLGPGK